MSTISPEIIELLDSEAARINSPEFIAADPVQFPRRYSKLGDIEIAALLCSTIAWGNRRMICRNCDRLLESMDSSPLQYVLDEAYESLDPDANVHRTFFNRNLQHYLRGLRPIYQKYGSLNAWAHNLGLENEPGAPWKLAEELNRAIAAANDGKADPRCLPTGLKNTALKRLNMALRWLVRRDGIVDMGVWDAMTPAQLYIPLDVHVGNVSRELGLLERRQDDRRAVEELTCKLRQLRPDDPAYYDYALFGIGVEGTGVKTNS